MCILVPRLLLILIVACIRQFCSIPPKSMALLRQPISPIFARFVCFCLYLSSFIPDAFNPEISQSFGGLCSSLQAPAYFSASPLCSFVKASVFCTTVFQIYWQTKIIACISVCVVSTLLCSPKLFGSYRGSMSRPFSSC